MLHRRDAMMRLGQMGLGSLTLPQLLRAESPPKNVTLGQSRAKSCILVYLWGGPPQHDTFDLKPNAPEGIRGLFDPIDSVVPGIQVCEHLPQIAKHTDKMAIIRSLTHPSNNHEPSVYHTLTGRVNNTLAVPRNARNRRDFPTLGSRAQKGTGPSINGPVPFVPPFCFPGSFCVTGRFRARANGWNMSIVLSPTPS